MIISACQLYDFPPLGLTPGSPSSSYITSYPHMLYYPEAASSGGDVKVDLLALSTDGTLEGSNKENKSDTYQKISGHLR